MVRPELPTSRQDSPRKVAESWKNTSAKAFVPLVFNTSTVCICKKFLRRIDLPVQQFVRVILGCHHLQIKSWKDKAKWSASTKGLVNTKWHDKRNVNILSTNFGLGPKTVKKGRKNREVVRVEKPASVDMYNSMSAVNCPEHLQSYYNACWPSKKWYKYLFRPIFYLSLINSFIIFENLIMPWGLASD